MQIVHSSSDIFVSQAKLEIFIIAVFKHETQNAVEKLYRSTCCTFLTEWMNEDFI
jgi:hypothetical protein